MVKLCGSGFRQRRSSPVAASDWPRGELQTEEGSRVSGERSRSTEAVGSEDEDDGEGTEVAGEHSADGIRERAVPEMRVGRSMASAEEEVGEGVPENAESAEGVVDPPSRALAGGAAPSAGREAVAVSL